MRILTMEKKEIYETPRLEAITFTSCDIVTASVGDNGFDGEADTDW